MMTTQEKQAMVTLFADAALVRLPAMIEAARAEGMSDSDLDQIEAAASLGALVPVDRRPSRSLSP
jgi:hypothetical protein